MHLQQLNGHDAIIKHCGDIEPVEVACYCFACDMGLEEGGKNGKHLIELILGKYLAYTNLLDHISTKI